METQNGFFGRIGKWMDQRMSSTQPVMQRGLRRLAWFLPNGGTILIVLAMVLTQHVWAQGLSPAASFASATTVNYQGKLANSDGTPITQNDLLVKFAVYNAAEGGDLLWPAGGAETHQVDVINGLFSVALGSITPGGIPTTLWTGDRFLEVTVGDETLSPREMIRSVPIAGMALTVPAGSLNSTHVHLTSGSVWANSSNGNIELKAEDQIVPGLEATVTLETDQTLVVFVNVQGAMSAESVSTMHLEVLKGGVKLHACHGLTFTGPTNETGSMTCLFDLPKGNYTVIVKANMDSGTGKIKPGATSMAWFAFSQ